MKGRRFFLWAAAICLMVAGLLALVASRAPDGLQRVAEKQGFAAAEHPSATSGSPLAGYELGGSTVAGKSLAGLIGAAATAGIAFGLFGLLARGGRPTPPESAAVETGG